MSQPSVTSKITAEEAALYDRQIRLWGLEAQNRLKNAAVLLIGMSPVGAELAKNLTLAGLKSLTLIDDQSVSEADLKGNFLLDRTTAMHKNRAEAVVPRCQQLNPLVQVVAVPVETSLVAKAAEELINSQGFDLVCCVDRGIDECLKISECCRRAPRLTFFSMGGVNGWFGYSFSDFGDDFEYASEEIVPIAGNDANLSQESVVLHEEVDLEPDEPATKKQRPSAAGGDAAGKSTEKRANKREKIIVRKQTSFTSFDNVMTVKNNAAVQGDVKRKRSRPPYPVGFYLFQIMAGFHYRFRRFPRLTSEKEDARNLRLERNSIMSELGDIKIPIPENFASSLFDQVPAVCAIVGGVMGQEIIKAVSRKDEPINNMFFYNPFDSTGCIAKIPR